MGDSSLESQVELTDAIIMQILRLLSTCLGIIQSLSASEVSDYSIKLSHKLEDGNKDQDFKLRYDFTKPTLKPGKYGIVKKDAIKKSQFDHNNSDIYKLKIDLPNDRSHITWVSYKALINSCFQDTLEIYLANDEGDISGINYHPSKKPKDCNPEKLTVNQKAIPEFKTVVHVIPATVSQGVDSERWLNQMETEKIKKEQQKEQPQSFWGKYWLYIVIGLFVMMSTGGG